MSRVRMFLLSVPILASQLPSPVAAGTFVVANINDSGAGSLRDALLQVNGAPGPHRITFDIPGGGVVMIQPLTFLPQINNQVAIDATTQPGYISYPSVAGTPMVELDGTLVPGSSMTGLRFNSTADGSSVRGLSIGGFSGAGVTFYFVDACTLRASHLGCDAAGTTAKPNGTGVYSEGSTGLVVGGPLARDRNVISGNSAHGVSLYQDLDARVMGNYIGTNATGTAALGNVGSGVVVSECLRSTVGGLSPGERNLISGNGERGVFLLAGAVAGPADANRVYGNWIGTNVYGTGAIPNLVHGIDSRIPYSILGDPAAPNVSSANGSRGIFVLGNRMTIQDNYVGTTYDGTRPLGNGAHGIALTSSGQCEILRNVVGDNAGSGIYVVGPTSVDNVIRGNAVGTNRSGATDLGNTETGIRSESPNNFIGGPLAGDGNLVAFNAKGVVVNVAVGNSIRRNRVYSSTGLDIDLEDNGITANDIGDTDIGANNRQNYPELSSVTYASDQLLIEGSLNTNSNQLVTIDIFSSPACHPFGRGGGETWVGSVSGATDPAGMWSFQFQSSGFPETVSGHYFTATATVLDADAIHANTSEMSPCVTLAPSVDVELPAASHYRFALGPARPQPARGSVVIPFSLARPSHVTLRAYDAAGRLAATLLDAVRDGGRHELSWDSSELAPGAYRVRLEAAAIEGSGERLTQSRSVVVVK